MTETALMGTGDHTLLMTPDGLEAGAHVVIDGVEVIVVAVTPHAGAAFSLTTRPVTDAD